MTTEKRLIDAAPYAEKLRTIIISQRYRFRNRPDMQAVIDLLEIVRNELLQIPAIDAVPVDEIKLHHVIIDNEGVPEVKLQIGDRYFLLRTDPVDVREVVHGYTLIAEQPEKVLLDRKCGICNQLMLATDNYCSMCGAKNEGERTDND